MFVKGLWLKDFRLFTNQVVRFQHQASLILGPNAAGKSSIIEAIDLLSTGASFRAGRVDEMIAFDQELARVKAKILPEPDDETSALAGLDELELSLLLTRGEVQGKKTRKTLYTVNQNRRRKKDFVGQLLTVVFRPEDLRLVEGSPSRRRDFFDKPLSLLFDDYNLSLNKYTKALRRRNKLLPLVREGQQSTSVLKFWNMSILKHGELLQKKRRDFCEFINSMVEPPLEMRLDYQPSIISQDRLDSYQSRAIAAGYTLIGPHKDDFEVELNFGQEQTNFQPISSFGSRGQKRLAVLWLKKAELQYLRHETDRLPVLLLDDILSELDAGSQELVLSLVDQEQVIITSTDSKLKTVIKQQLGRLGEIRLGS